MRTLSKKMVLMGDFSVGKTSLIRRFVDNAFSDSYLSTIGVKISRKNVELARQHTEVQLLIWDIEGETEIKTIPSHYLIGASGAVIVADATRPETVTSVLKHLAHFRSVNPGAPVFLALNKSDLSEAAQRMLETVETLVQGAGPCLLTSAKSGQNVETLFERAAEMMVQP